MIDSEHRDLPDDGPGRLASSLGRPRVPESLEPRVRGSLIARGLLRDATAGRRWRSPLLAAIAAGVLCFVAGRQVERVSHRGDAAATAPLSRRERYVLLLYDVPDRTATSNDVEEHRQWARSLVRGGHEVTGEKLAPAELTLAPVGIPQRATPRAPVLEGFFVISARDETEALEIARSSPHFRHGGQVVIRHIDPT